MKPVSADPAPRVPVVFGGTWDAFLRDWWLNAALPDSPGSMAAALDTLWRLWPEEAERIAQDSSRGPSVVAPALELGAMLSACESIPSFDEVLMRLKGGERSAYSELVVGSALARLSHAPSFAPPIDGRVLDAACMIDGQRLYFEVVAPERSDAGIARIKEVGRLSEAVRASIKSCRVEIEILDGYADSDLPVVVEAILLAPSIAWTCVADKARLRRIDAGQSLPPLFDNTDGMQVVIAGHRELQGDSASVVIRHEASDARAKRIFNEKYRQFSDTVPIVLVVNVSAVSEGMKEWPAHMSRLLQRDRNRKVGAVAFFDQGIVGPPERIRRRWRLLANPHAYCKIPEQLLAGLESLDESSSYGLEPYERLTAAV